MRGSYPESYVKPLDMSTCYTLCVPTDTLQAAADRYRQAAKDLEAARTELHKQIRTALTAGTSKAEVARVTGLSRETIYTVNRG